MSTLEPVPSFYKLRLRASEELKKWKRKEHEGGTTEEGRKREGRTTESGLWTSTPYDSELVVRIFVMEEETYGEEGTLLRAYMNSGKKITKKKKKKSLMHSKERDRKFQSRITITLALPCFQYRSIHYGAAYLPQPAPM